MADSRLRQFLLAVEALATRRLPAGVVFSYGEKSVAAHGKAPRVAWVRDGLTDQYGAPSDVSTSEADGKRIVAVRRCTVQAHVWGADEAEVESMLDALVWAILEEHGPTQADARGSWATAGWTGAGEAAVLEFEVAQPVYEPTGEVLTSRPLSAPFDTTGAASTDGILQAGEG